MRDIEDPGLNDFKFMAFLVVMVHDLEGGVYTHRGLEDILPLEFNQVFPVDQPHKLLHILAPHIYIMGHNLNGLYRGLQIKAKLSG